MRLILTVVMFAGVCAAFMGGFVAAMFLLGDDPIPVGFLLIIIGVSALGGGAAGVCDWCDRHLSGPR